MNDGLMLSMASLGDLCLHSNTDMKPYDCSTRFHFVFSNAKAWSLSTTFAWGTLNEL